MYRYDRTMPMHAHITTNHALHLFLMIAPVKVTIANSSNTQHAGENYTLTCIVSGGGTDVPTYQWLKNGSYLTNETNETLSLTPLTQGNSSDYECKATKSGRVAESDSFDIDVTGKANYIYAISILPFNQQCHH